MNMRLHRYASIVLAISLAASAHCANLRGKVDGVHQYSPRPFPLANTTVTLLRGPPGQPVRVAQTKSDKSGMYYFRNIAPGAYILVISGERFPVAVTGSRTQDIAPVLIRISDKRSR